MATKTRCTPNVPLCVIRGATWRQDFVWRVNGVAKDLTDWTARLQFIDPNDGTVIADLSTANTKLTITPAEGRTSAVLTHTETRAITQNEGIYALFLKSPTGDRVKRSRGPVDFEPADTADVDAP